MFRLMRLQERNFTIWRGNVKSYLKMDFYRMLTSKYFGIGILGVVGAVKKSGCIFAKLLH